MNNRLKIKLSKKQHEAIIITIAKKGNKTKKNLAQHLNIPQSSVSLWIRESFIPAKHFNQVHEYLGLKVPTTKN